MEAWWKEPIRAVTVEFPASDVATIDVTGIVNETHRGAVNTLCVFAIGYWPGGTAFYQSRLAPHYPGLGDRDLLAEAIEIGHRNEQRVVAYVASIWGERELFHAHPDWAQRKADGSVTSWDDAYTTVAMCPNSPYRDYFASVVREISDNYDVDGFYFDEPSFQSWCSCDYCREKFYDEYHQPLPTEVKWGGPLFQRFLAWRYQQISSWRQELYDLVKQEDRCVFFQGAFPLAFLIPKPIEVSGLQFENPYQERFGVAWYVPLAHAAHLPHSAEVGDIVHFELYRRAVREPLWWYGVSLRYGQAIGRGKPVLVLSMMAQSPFDLYGLPEAELRLAVAEILANSGSPLFARYYPDRVDEEAWNIVYDRLREARALESYLENRESIKYAAILFSQSSLERFDHVLDKPSHLGCLKGFSKALLQEHIPFDIVTEPDLTERLDGYKVLILPDASCLSTEAGRAIREFSARGGGVVASYEAGMYDEAGCRTLEDDFSDLFGLKYIEESPTWFGFDVYMRVRGDYELGESIPVGKRIPTGGVQVGVEPTNARIVAEVLGGAAVHYGPLGDEAGLPAILTSQSEGCGRTVFFAPPLGNRYLEFGVGDHRKLMATAVRWAAACEPPLRLENAPRTMAITAFRQLDSDRMVVHLVNSVRDELVQPISEVLESRDVRLEVDVDHPPSKVICLGEGEEPSWLMKDGTLVVTIPSVCYSTVVVIER